jgi:hypothetical protein
MDFFGCFCSDVAGWVCFDACVVDGFLGGILSGLMGMQFEEKLELLCRICDVGQEMAQEARFLVASPISTKKDKVSRTKGKRHSSVILQRLESVYFLLGLEQHTTGSRRYLVV